MKAEVSKKTVGKIGLIGSIAILIGSVIGIGIFFKNGTVFADNNANTVGVLMSWIISSIIAFTAALSFAKIGFGNNPKKGLAGSVDAHIGKKFGRFISINTGFFYNGLLIFAIAMFTSEATFNMFETTGSLDKIHVGYVFLLGVFYMLFFSLFNLYAKKFSNKFQLVSSILKFLPLIMVGLAGIIYASLNPTTINNEYIPNTPRAFSFTGMMNSIPAILFAFDSFLCISSLKKDMKNPDKNLPLTIVIGMVLVIFIYLFITVGQILVVQGSASGVFAQVFENNPAAAKAMKIFINVFIFIAISGVLNSFILTSLRSNESLVDEKIIYGWWVIKKIGNKLNRENASGFILSLGIFFFWTILVFIPSVSVSAYGTDAFIDGVSNFPTLVMFGIYGLTIAFAMYRKIKTKEKRTKSDIMFFVYASIAIIGCSFVFCYQFIYRFNIAVFIDPNSIVNWGLFFTKGFTTKNFMIAPWMYALVILFVSVPLINDYLFILLSKNNDNKKDLLKLKLKELELSIKKEENVLKNQEKWNSIFSVLSIDEKQIKINFEKEKYSSMYIEEFAKNYSIDNRKILINNEINEDKENNYLLQTKEELTRDLIFTYNKQD